MRREEIISMAKDVIAFLLVKDYERSDIDLILRRAVEINEDDWIKEDDE